MNDLDNFGNTDNGNIPPIFTKKGGKMLERTKKYVQHYNGHEESNKFPTFRAKGVITNIEEFRETDKIFYAANIKIGSFDYFIPIQKNAREGDVLELIINVIKVKK